jgi:hypothetical protein
MTVGRSCRVCFSSDRKLIEDAIAAGMSFRAVATEYADGSISESSIQRHWRNHVAAQFRSDTEIEYLTEPSDILDRVLEIADSARNTRRSAEATGNAVSVAKASDTELRALAVAMDRLGIRDTNVLTNYKFMYAMVYATWKLIKSHPKVGLEIIELLGPDSEGTKDFILQTIRDEEKKQQEIKK